jgi:twitching motility protein PilT
MAADPNGSGASSTVTDFEVNKLFRTVVKNGGSDLHLKVGSPPVIRLSGSLRQMDMKPLSQADVEKLMLPTVPERVRHLIEQDGGVDYAHVLPEGQRFRVNLFQQRGQLSMAARRVNTEVPTFDELHLPSTMPSLCESHQGLIILAGVTGSGKSTTIAAMLDSINKSRRCHILTIEDPIEYVFTDKKAFVNQREVGIDTPSWSMALKHAVREDPDVILVGEMRDFDTFNAGMQASETGHLVFGTLHSSTAPSTIGRILDLFPADMHDSVRQGLAFNLRVIMCQRLLPCIKDGIDRVPAIEIMINNPTVRKLIKNGEDSKLGDAIRIGIKEGMVDFTESLRQLVETDMIDRAVAYEVAPNADALKMALKGIQTSTRGIL